MQQYISLLTTSLTSCFSWLESFFSSLSASSFYLSLFVMILIIRFLIMPLTGSGVGSIFSGKSDKVSLDKGNKGSK